MVVKGKGHEERYIRNFLVGVFKRATQGQLFKWEQRAICYRPSIPSFMYTTLYFSEKHIRAPPLKMPRDILVSSPATGHWVHPTAKMALYGYRIALFVSFGCNYIQQVSSQYFRIEIFQSRLLDCTKSVNYSSFFLRRRV